MNCRYLLNAHRSGAARRWDLIALLAVFGIVTVSRLKFWAISLWYWDEFLYAQALHRFNLSEHSPHPPGYPLYVALTRGINYLLHNDLKSLVFCNVVFSSLLVFPLYFLYRPFSSHKVALWVTLLSLFNLTIWLQSETGFSDMSALFWMIASLALLYRYESNRFFYMGMISLGIAVGIRPQSALYGVFLVPLLLWLKVRRGEIRSAAVGLALLAAVCLIWVVPLIRATGNLSSYIRLLREYSQDQIFPVDRGYLLMRKRMSLIAFIENKFVLMWGARALGDAVMGLTVLGLAVYAWKGLKRAFPLLLLVFLPMLLVDFLWLDFRVPRYGMATILLTSFFVVYGLLELFHGYPPWKNLFAPALVLGLLLFSVHGTLPFVRSLHTTKSAPAQLADHIRRHLNPKTDALIVHLDILPFIGYELADFVVLAQNNLDESIMPLIRSMDWYYVGYHEPAGQHAVEFHCPARHMAKVLGGLVFDLELTKTEVLYANGYRTWVTPEQTIVRQMQTPWALCYLKNTGRPKVLLLETEVASLNDKKTQLYLKLENAPLAAAVLPQGQSQQLFLLNEPYRRDPAYLTLALQAVHSDPESAPIIHAVHWWDIKPPPESQTQIIEFDPKDQPLMRSGWADLEREGNVTYAWSEGDYSDLAVRLQPQGLYEVSFRARPIINTQAPDTPQAITLCLREVCSPDIELAPHAWRTYTRLLFNPATNEKEEAGLRFYYRFTNSRTLPNGDLDNRGFGVAFDYVKLVLIGNPVP